MIGYKVPPNLKRADLISEAYARLRNEDMTLEFSIAPKTEEDQPLLEWFEQNCPHQFIADCVRRVIRRTQGLAQEHYIKKNTDLFMYYWGESIHIVGIYHTWRDGPEVQEALVEEKRSFTLQAGEYGDFEVQDRPHQPGIVQPPERVEDNERPATDPPKPILDSCLEICEKVGAIEPNNCSLCNRPDPDGHEDDCPVIQAGALGTRIRAALGRGGEEE